MYLKPTNIYQLKISICISLFFLTSFASFGQSYTISSPDSKTNLTVSVQNEEITWSVEKYGASILKNVHVDMSIDEVSLAKGAKVIETDKVDINEEFLPVLPVKRSKILNNCRELQLKFENEFTLYFRVYNEGIAYRFSTDKKGTIEVTSEVLEIPFSEDTMSFFPKEDKMYSHYERLYQHKKVNEIPKGDFCSLPVMFEENEVKLLFSEADLFDYPNMFLESDGRGSLKATFPKYVLNTKPTSDRSEEITEEANYIAKTEGTRNFPWRFFIVSNTDTTFLENDMVSRLSRSSKIKNTDWIKAGRVAWDWYNANNVYDVDFESGINTETYKYYIDFASKYGLEYVILDEGWTKSTTEIMESTPDINIHELIQYGKSKNVGIILWCLWKPLQENMDAILKTYGEWGAKGIKVDFMQRADQAMVNSYEEIAKTAANYHLLVDYHGAYKPSGLRKAYPNVVNYEGVFGNENNKWSPLVTPEHTLTIPFIRMAAGPMDFTPGAMSNAHKDNFKVSHTRPMSLGTRVHQAAMYVVYDSPLQMLCDSPSAYLKDGKTIEVISQIPTTWDETIALEASVGKYLVMARKKDNTWYIGGMTNSEMRDLNIDLSFLPEGNYEATILQDGINADKYAEDYKILRKEISTTDALKIHMSKGGGYVAIIKKK